MAAIDKIYGNIKQKEQLKNWCIDNCKEALNYFYDWNIDQLNDNQNHCICNFPEKIDKIILNKCNIKWVTDYIKFQYGF